MEGDRERQGANNPDPKTRCFVILGIVGYFTLIGISLIFFLLDTIQSGSIQYQYTDSYQYQYYYTNSISCGHKVIMLHCEDKYRYGDICTVINTDSYNSIEFDRKNVNASYNESHANIYYISTCIGCIISYMLFPMICLFHPNADIKQCGMKQKHKYLILCFLSMIATVISVILGITLSTNTQNCSHGLYQYIQLQIGQNIWDNHYKWTNDSPQIQYGVTLIFMMITCGITVLLTVSLMRCSIGNSKKYNNIYVEGIEESLSLQISKRYGTATSAKMSVNINEEGIA